jgi:hypothetical protein
MKSIKTWSAIIASVAIFGILVFLLTSCAASRITDARQAILVSSEKVKRSTNYIVCIQDKEGNRYSCYWNSHCWNCKNSAIPTNWNVVTMKNGKKFIEPIL